MLDKIINLSVHELVDFLFRPGDIDTRVFNLETMSKGNQLHLAYQKRKIGNCLNEYYLTTTEIIDDFKAVIEGKADTIRSGNIPIIEEIKSTVEDLESHIKKYQKWHLAQAICYGYMYLKENHQNDCVIKLVYISQSSDEKKEIEFNYNFDKLYKKVKEYISNYLVFYKEIYNQKNERNNSAKNLKFPYEKYRKGQKDFISLGSKIAKDGGVAFIEAPTGIGKTISSLYPFVKSFEYEDNDKIFYLTAKNTGKDAAYDACKLMIDKGLNARAIYITAREKICSSMGRACNQDECPYAKNYYDKLNEVLAFSIKNKKLFNAKTIKEISEKFQICPFEFSLDLSQYCDIVIADYNYFFDPISHLQRYFDSYAKNYLIIVDEAHNLLDRASNMYSEKISYALVCASEQDYRFGSKKLKKSFSRLRKIFESINLDEDYKLLDDIEHEMYLAINNLSYNISEFSKDSKFHPSLESIDLSRRLNRFLKLYENKEESDVLYFSKSNGDITLNLLCLDPSSRIRDSINSVKSALLFSATLTPIEYYRTVLGSEIQDHELIIPSPFPKENFKLLIAPAKMKYKDRDFSLNQVISYIDSFISTKKGNYIIYSPSFEYLEKLKPHFKSNETFDVIYQNRDMDDKEKMLFLNCFKLKNQKSIVGFCVLGGAFSEGIDLVADSLIGVVIIGVGLPTISFERNLIKEYYAKKEMNGFSYAYKHPGMNKVSQAVGRLIRSETDIGAAMLIDDRYFYNEYKNLFKNEWKDYTKVTSGVQIKNILKKFFKQ